MHQLQEITNNTIKSWINGKRLNNDEIHVLCGIDNMSKDDMYIVLWNICELGDIIIDEPILNLIGYKGDYFTKTRAFKKLLKQNPYIKFTNVSDRRCLLKSYIKMSSNAFAQLIVQIETQNAKYLLFKFLQATIVHSIKCKYEMYYAQFEKDNMLEHVQYLIEDQQTDERTFNELEQCKQQLQTAHKQKRELIDENQQYRCHIKKLMVDNEKYRSRMQPIDHVRVLYKKRLNQAQNLVTRNERYKMENTKYEQRNKRLEDKIENLKNQKSHLKYRLNRMQCKNKQIQIENNRLRVRAMRAYSKSTIAANIPQSNHLQCASSHNTIELENLRLKSEITQMELKIAKINSNLSELNSQYNKKLQQIQKLKDIITLLLCN